MERCCTGGKGFVMKKIVDDVRLIFKCCSLYYQDGLGQKEICELLGISRPTVSRMLTIGRERGIVRIEIQNPDNIAYGQLERMLEKKYHLQEVVVVPSSPLSDGQYPISSEIGSATLEYLSRVLMDGYLVGITMGLAIQNVVRSDYFIRSPIRATFVPLVGGVAESRLDIHSNYLAQEFADRFAGNCVQFFAPAVFSRREVLEGFLEEKTIRNVTRLYPRLDLVLMGIGIPSTEHSTILRTGYVDRSILAAFAARGAVGDIALRYFDADGDTTPFRDFNERVAGIPLDLLKKILRRVGVAGGSQKKDAVRGAIRGGFINVLITDIDCAEHLL